MIVYADTVLQMTKTDDFHIITFSSCCCNSSLLLFNWSFSNRRPAKFARNSSASWNKNAH